MEKHLSFHYFFMQRLPQAQRTQLGEGEAEENAPVSIAAVRGGTRGRGGKSRGQVGGQRAQPAAAAAPTASNVPAADPTPSDLARASSGLCHFHWIYAESFFFNFFLTSHPLLLQGRASEAQPVRPSCAGVKRLLPLCFMAAVLPGIFCWPLYLFPSLGWIFCGISSS
jgi:hypothetical protein